MNLQDLANRVQDRFEKLERTIRELATGSPLQSASVTKGRVRFIGGLLRIDSGGRVEIVGTLEIDGTTTVTGTFTVTGPWSLDGDGTIAGDVTGTGELVWNGPWDLNGPGTIAGNADITGTLTLLKDLIVSSVGKIEVQGTNPIRLRQVGGLARMDLGGTASIWSGGDGVTINATNGGFINVYSGGVDIGGAGETVDIIGTVKMQSLSPKPAGVTGAPVTWDPTTKRLYAG